MAVPESVRQLCLLFNYLYRVLGTLGFASSANKAFILVDGKGLGVTVCFSQLEDFHWTNVNTTSATCAFLLVNFDFGHNSSFLLKCQHRNTDFYLSLSLQYQDTIHKAQPPLCPTPRFSIALLGVRLLQLSLTSHRVQTKPTTVNLH